MVLGRIGAPYGVHGMVRVQTFSEDVSRLGDFTEWWVGVSEAYRSIKVKETRIHSGNLLALLDNVTTPEQALTLKGQWIAIPREQLGPTNPGEYYQSDLIGLRVTNRQDEKLGIITAVLENGAQLVLEIKEGLLVHLIPFVEVFIDQVDIENQCLKVDWELGA